MARIPKMMSVALVLAMGPMAFAQTAGGSAQASAGASANVNEKQQDPESSIAAGTALNVQLDGSVDSKKAKTGDQVLARTTGALKTNGKTVLPNGTKLVGHVTRATARAKGDADSTLAVQFDRAVLKGGREIPLQLSVQALAAAESAAAVSGDDLQPMSSASAGASSGAGGRGAVSGVGSTVAGAASGAATTVPRTATNATGAVNSTVSSATGAAGGVGGGLGANGQLTSTSRGVFGLNGVSLTASAANSSEGSVIASTGKNVHLDTGTRMLLVVQAATVVSASAQQ